MRNILRTRRKGFSLIELLIVVAIIAALVGVAVPFFQDNLSEAQRTKAGQDLEVIKKAISLYDARESRPLVGTALDPLLGRYMQELPKDPWGNDYLYDGAAGVLASYGADALPEGSGGDTDIVVYTKPPLMINRVQYQGSWGRPRKVLAASTSAGNKFIISLTKPAVVPAGLGGGNSEQEIVLIRTVGRAPDSGNERALHQADLGGGGQTWDMNAVADNLHRPENAVVVVHCILDTTGIPAAQSITPTMALDFASATPPFNDAGGVAGAVAVGATIQESTYQSPASPASPLDTAVYGAVVGGSTGLYRRVPQPMELVSGQRRGVKIEKY